MVWLQLRQAASGMVALPFTESLVQSRWASASLSGFPENSGLK